MTIKEEEFDGYVIIDCPKCGKSKVYYKEGEKIYCPICGNDKQKILKNIKGKVNGRKNYYSVDTEESFFNY